MYSLPKLPYSYSALEPYIETQIMEFHHAKHQQAYVDGLNAALLKHPELEEKPLVTLLQDLSAVPEDIRTAVRNHGGGVENHTFFWESMTHRSGGKPVGQSAQHITQFFDSCDQFKAIFTASAKDRFGSGWVWLSVDPSTQHLVLTSTANQDTPLSQGLSPILALDVWEHAYYLQYFNRRVDYVAAWWNVVDWEKVEERYVNVIK